MHTIYCASAPWMLWMDRSTELGTINLVTMGNNPQVYMLVIEEGWALPWELINLTLSVGSGTIKSRTWLSPSKSHVGTTFRHYTKGLFTLWTMKLSHVRGHFFMATLTWSDFQKRILRAFGPSQRVVTMHQITSLLLHPNLHLCNEIFTKFGILCILAFLWWNIIRNGWIRY